MKYAYDVHLLDGDYAEQTRFLNWMGEAGWELLTVQGSTAYFRRQISGSERE
jgi:hypothetical protein